MSFEKLKMYILVLDDVPSGYAINSAAHASLACYLEHKHRIQMQLWLEKSFKKVTCKVTREQFDQAMKIAKDSYQKTDPYGYTIIRESTLGDREMCVAFAPRFDVDDMGFDPFFKTLPLWK